MATTYRLPPRPDWLRQARAIVTLQPGAPFTASAIDMAWAILRAHRDAAKTAHGPNDGAAQRQAVQA